MMLIFLISDTNEFDNKALVMVMIRNVFDESSDKEDDEHHISEDR